MRLSSKRVYGLQLRIDSVLPVSSFSIAQPSKTCEVYVNTLAFTFQGLLSWLMTICTWNLHSNCDRAIFLRNYTVFTLQLPAVVLAFCLKWSRTICPLLTSHLQMVVIQALKMFTNCKLKWNSSGLPSHSVLLKHCELTIQWIYNTIHRKQSGATQPLEASRSNATKVYKSEVQVWYNTQRGNLRLHKIVSYCGYWQKSSHIIPCFQSHVA